MKCRVTALSTGLEGIALSRGDQGLWGPNGVSPGKKEGWGTGQGPCWEVPSTLGG